ncbi:hypothetical protein PM082_012185 [Marasmius tenuissimus]|nr:hypothetical protein PM082_012185 [Marasmius tenuissimus]
MIGAFDRPQGYEVEWPPSVYNDVCSSWSARDIEPELLKPRCGGSQKAYHVEHASRYALQVHGDFGTLHFPERKVSTAVPMRVCYLADQG